jgi:hypothetical protein
MLGGANGIWFPIPTRASEGPLLAAVGEATLEGEAELIGPWGTVAQPVARSPTSAMAKCPARRIDGAVIFGYNDARSVRVTWSLRRVMARSIGQV